MDDHLERGQLHGGGGGAQHVAQRLQAQVTLTYTANSHLCSSKCCELLFHTCHDSTAHQLGRKETQKKATKKTREPRSRREGCAAVPCLLVMTAGAVLGSLIWALILTGTNTSLLVCAIH